MGWINLFDVVGVRCCSARGSSSSVSISPSGGVTGTDPSMQMIKISLDTWANNADTSLFSFSNGGIKISEAGTYLISASLYYKGGVSKDNHGIHVLDTNYKQVMSAHYYNYNNATSGGCGCAPKIVTLPANSILYLCGRTNDSTVTPTVDSSNESTFLTIVKLS